MKQALENKHDKDTYWKYTAVANAVLRMQDRNAVQEFINVLRAYKRTDRDKAGLFYVTDKGKDAINQAIIMLDKAKV